MKKIVSLILVTLMLVASLVPLVSCQTGNGGDEELILWWPSGKANMDIIESALARFKAENPDINVKVVYKAVDSFDAYKISLNDDKTRPDLAILDHVYVQALAYDNQLANLSALGSDDIKSKYPEGLYNANTYNGNAYALPFSANTVVLMYNKDILDACGVAVPTTLDELLVACETIENKGHTAFAQPQNSFSAMEFASYVARRGGKLCSDDYKSILFNSTEVKAAINDWRALSAYASQNSYEEDKFYNGKVAFVEMGSWALSKVTGSSARFNCGFTEMVTIDPNTPNYSGLGLYSLCVSEKSEHKADAYKLALFLSTDKEVQLAYNKNANLFPVTNEALTDSYYTENEALSVYASQLTKVAPRPGTPVWPDMESAIVNMLVSVVRAEGDIDAIITKFQNEVQAAADRFFK